MRSGMDGDREAPSAEAFAELSDELARNARLVREQAASIAHYKKMYDRSSALAKIGVWECDLATEALTWTDGVYDLFELPRGSPLERAKIVEFYDEQSRREMERLRAGAISDGGGFTLDIHIRTARGNQRWIRLTADVEREGGHSVRIFGTKQDISQEKSAQEKVQSLQTELIHVSRKSAMGAMAATLAHELNQPLAAIINYVAGTRRAINSPEQAKDILESGLEAIETCAFRASDIIRRLRAMTSENAGRRQPINPNPLIRDAGSLAMVGADETVILRYDLADGAVVSVDPVQIQQVLISLINNAFEAVQESSRREITVTTSVAGGAVRICVEDTGHGIPAEMLKTLFESFVSSKPGGMGVGLSISRTIIEAHGGKISAANRETGGASFCVALPLAASPQHPEVRAEP